MQCMECDETFNKHHKLRSHVAEQHNPKGTLPFICTHHDCNKSFSTGSKLRSHSKVHDGKMERTASYSAFMSRT